MNIKVILKKAFGNLVVEKKMKQASFVAICPFKLGDKCKLLLDNKPIVLSKDIYTVSDILTTQSAKTGDVSFHIIVKDSLERDLAPRKVDSLILIQ